MNPPEIGKSAGMKRAEDRRESLRASYERRRGLDARVSRRVCQRLALPAPSPASRESQPCHRGAEEEQCRGLRYCTELGLYVHNPIAGDGKQLGRVNEQTIVIGLRRASNRKIKTTTEVTLAELRAPTA